MKAWLVRKKGELCADVVFAETRGKARALALRTDSCENVSFTDIEVTRIPEADKYYTDGKWRLDCENPQDRIILVRDCGFYCDSDYVYPEVCGLCSAKEYCDKYKDELDYMKEE